MSPGANQKTGKIAREFSLRHPVDQIHALRWNSNLVSSKPRVNKTQEDVKHIQSTLGIVERDTVEFAIQWKKFSVL